MQEHKERKRIGILTYHYAINDGAVLQAYALLQALGRYIGNSKVEIVDYRPLVSELKNLKESVVSRKLNTIPSKIKRYIKFSSFVKERLKLGDKKIISNDYRGVREHLNDGYDAVIVGSDEIWKIEHGRFARPFPNIYWLPMVSGPRKIAFAASANKLQYRYLTSGQKSWIKNSLEGFDLLGVRDNHTLEFLKYIGISDESKITIVPDPTFIFDPGNKTIKPRLERYGIDFKRPRAAVLLTDREANREICGYLRFEGYQVAAFSYFNAYANVNLYGKMDPEEWAQAFGHFDVCITDRFHGIVFSLKNKIPVIAVDDIFNYKSYESKNACLMNEFGLSDYYWDIKKDGFSLEKFKEMLRHATTHSEFDKIDAKLIEKRADCLSFIKKIGKLVGTS